MKKGNTTLNIILRNICTVFNLVNVILAIMIIIVGSYKNLLFIIIAIANTSISIFNELRAKKIVDKMRLISEQPATIIKNDVEEQISIHDLQKGDTILLKKGDQLVVDAKIVSGQVEVNESFITGEADNITKKIADELISGSYIAAGTCQAKVVAVGEDVLIRKIEKTAKTVKYTKSKLFTITNNIVKYISYALIPIGILLLWARFRVDGSDPILAVTSTVAALINMIPEGLVLLTSSVLALATIRLSKKQVLVQDLYAIETMARVDTICLDKTGTLTTVKDGKEVVRKESSKLISYFQNNDVSVKIISGDDFKTVKNIAETVGIKNVAVLDLSKINNKELPSLIEQYNVFAKAKPEHKQLIVRALKAKNHIVAMTGDGVNDVLAMKEADCSISVGDGTDVARRTARLVLLDSDFSTIPSIIDEGRQTINNLERSATLFLTKTIYASILAVIFTIAPLTYPFIPIEMSLLNFLCIGFPAFVLALEPNHERIKDKFVYNIRKFSLPIGLIIASLIIILSIIAEVYGFENQNLHITAGLIVFILNLILIYLISKPLNKLRKILLIAIVLIMACALIIPFTRTIFFAA